MAGTADNWQVETVERVKVTPLPTGKAAEAATQDEAFGQLVRELTTAGDITINDGRAALGLEPATLNVHVSGMASPKQVADEIWRELFRSRMAAGTRPLRF